MSSKPVYIAVMSVLAFALIITATLLISGNLGNKEHTPHVEYVAGDIGDLFSNDKTFPDKIGETLRMTIDESNNYFVAGKENELYIKLGFEAIEYKVEKTLPLNVSLVIDKSGSMSGDKLEQAKRAAVKFIESLSPEDYVSIVTYGSIVNVIYHQSRIEDLNMLRERIMSIRDEGGTFLSGGLETGIKEVLSKKKSGYINRVIIFSDGHANEGVTTENGLKDIAESARSKGISVSTMGVGLDYDEKIMSAMAISGSGNYHFIKDAEQIPVVLEKELSQMQNIVASQAMVKIVHDPAIEFVETYGYSAKSTGGYIEIPIRDFFSMDKGSAILYFKSAGKKISDHNIKISLLYKDAIHGNKELTFNSGVALSITDDQKVFNDNLDTEILGEVLKIQNTLDMERANLALEKGDKEQAVEIYNKIITKTEQENSSLGLIELNDQVDYMKKQKDIVNTIDSTSSEEAKEYFKLNRSTNTDVQQGRSGN